MTEAEKLAEEYAQNNIGFQKLTRESFLAGYKAGKPKWHKVADELPEEEGYYLVFDKGTRNIIIGMFVDGKFESCFPVAWCEIPKYEEE